MFLLTILRHVSTSTPAEVGKEAWMWIPIYWSVVSEAEPLPALLAGVDAMWKQKWGLGVETGLEGSDSWEKVLL